MTKEQRKGAMIFLDAINADMKINQTNKKEKIGIKLQLINAIKADDAEKTYEAIRRYHNLTMSSCKL